MRRFTEGGLQYAVNGARLVVVTFSASWGAFSLALTAALKQIGEALGDHWVTVRVVEADKDLAVPARYGVCGLPTAMLFKVWRCGLDQSGRAHQTARIYDHA